jgi:RNA polymerase sigma factor (sigma-70 family)
MARGQLDRVVQHLRRLVGPSIGLLRTDAELVQSFVRCRDEAAFAGLVERHGGLVRAVCRHVLRDEADVDDAFQATFFILARKAAAIRAGQSVASWLHGVAYRTALNARRTAMRRQHHEKQSSCRAPEQPASAAALRELQAILDAEVDRLPAKVRTPFVLCCLEGFSKAEAARELGWKEGTVSGRLAQARKLLWQRLARRGVALSAALCAGAVTAAPADAGVTTALATAAVRGALSAGAGACTSRAAVLAEGVLKGMAAARARSALLMMVLLGVLAVGVGAAARQELAAKPEAARGDGAPAAAGAEQPQPAAEQPRTDQYGDPLPAGAVARLGALRLVHEALGGAPLSELIFTPDGKLVVSMGTDGHRLWDVATGKELPLAESSRRAPVITAGSKLLTFEYELQPPGSRLFLRDLATGKEVMGVERQVDGWRVWDLATGKDVPQSALDLKDALARALERGKQLQAGGSWKLLAPDGTILATFDAEKKRIRLLDPKTEKELPPLLDQPAVGGPMALSFSPDGKLLAAPNAGGPTVRVWDVTTRKVVHELQGKDFQVFFTVFSPDGKLLAGADNHSVTFWDVATGKRLHEFGHTYFLSALAFAPDSKTLVTGATYTDPVIRLWDPFTGKETGQWRGHMYGIDDLAFSPDGKLVASASQDETIRLWDFATSKEVRRIDARQGIVGPVAFLADGKLLASVGKVAIRVWDVTSGRELRSIAPKEGYFSASFSPDGKMVALAAYDDKLVRLLNLADGKEIRRLAEGPATVRLHGFSPDGKLLATSAHSGPAVRLWDVASGRQMREVSGPSSEKAPVTAFTCAFSPDGRSLAVGYSDEMIRLWEVASGQERTRFSGHRDVITSLAFSPDGTLLASGSADRTAVVWDVGGRSAAGRPRRGDLNAKELEVLWADLAGGDAHKAYLAVQALGGGGKQAVPFLKEHLRPAPTADARRIEQLLADLDSERFAVRDRAARELEDLGDVAEPALRAALTGKPSPEVRRRVEALVEQCDPAKSAKRLRDLRAVEVLEHAGTAAAQDVLRGLVAGAAEARLTREAKASLERLGKHAGAMR